MVMGRERGTGEYYNKKVKADYAPELSGLSHTQLSKQRGFKGIKLGPVAPGRKLSKEEVAEIEKRMREEGKL